MEEFDPVYWLELLKVDILVDSLVFNGLLVLVELHVPLISVAREAFGVGAPVCHAES